MLTTIYFGTNLALGFYILIGIIAYGTSYAKYYKKVKGNIPKNWIFEFIYDETFDNLLSKGSTKWINKIQDENILLVVLITTWPITIGAMLEACKNLISCFKDN